jgi:choline dehydrogenase-like flavoprotein
MAAADSARQAEIAVIGSGPGGAVTATWLAEAGRDVALIEEGEHLPLSSAPHFSREEILQKYRNGGINVAMGKAKVAYVEGRCVGGGSEINRGLYHRIAPETLDHWRRDYAVDALSADELRPHYEVCEQIARVSYLPGAAPQISLRLQAGAAALGWACVEAPRLFSYAADWEAGAPGVKQSMTETFVPRFLAAGGRLAPQMRVRRLGRHNGRWHLHVLQDAGGTGRRETEIAADTVVVACGAVQTPALLRRSGITRNVGDQLRWHPMVKVVACFAHPINQLSELEPVHQVKEFDPRFSMGCSISKRPALALALVEHPGALAEVERSWRHMAIYYVQSTGGSGTVRPLPGFRDPLVRARHNRADMADLADGLTKLCTCLFAAGATAIYPGVSGLPVLRSEADLQHIPRELPADRANLTALHLFSSCPMGEDERRCAVDSFGRVHGVDRLYVADASLLCGPTVVNPQGTVMAVAHRNAQQLLDGGRRQALARAVPSPSEKVDEASDHRRLWVHRQFGRTPPPRAR